MTTSSDLLARRTKSMMRSLPREEQEVRDHFASKEVARASMASPSERWPMPEMTRGFDAAPSPAFALTSL